MIYMLNKIFPMLNMLPLILLLVLLLVLSFEITSIIFNKDTKTNIISDYYIILSVILAIIAGIFVSITQLQLLKKIILSVSISISIFVISGSLLIFSDYLRDILLPVMEYFGELWEIPTILFTEIAIIFTMNIYFKKIILFFSTEKKNLKNKSNILNLLFLTGYYTMLLGIIYWFSFFYIIFFLFTIPLMFLMFLMFLILIVKK